MKTLSQHLITLILAFTLGVGFSKQAEKASAQGLHLTPTGITYTQTFRKADLTHLAIALQHDCFDYHFNPLTGRYYAKFSMVKASPYNYTHIPKWEHRYISGDILIQTDSQNHTLTAHIYNMRVIERKPGGGVGFNNIYLIEDLANISNQRLGQNFKQIQAPLIERVLDSFLTELIY